MKQSGLVLKSNGGLYEVETENGVIGCRPRGIFRYEGTRVLVGDRVLLSQGEGEEDGVRIDEILERRSLLQRPPMANLDVLFVVIAAAKPAPILTTVDRMIALCEDCSVRPVLLVTKADLDRENAERLAEIYRQSGYPVCLTSSRCDGAEALEQTRAFLAEQIGDGIAAFAGASGVGKSSLLRALYPSLPLEVGALSKKIDRGRQTTRIVSLFPLRDLTPEGRGYLADTPGFSVLDTIRESNLTKENLALSFREFLPHLGECRYTDCNHLKAEGCAILRAIEEGKIPKSRHESYCAMYEELKNKHDWD